MKVHHALPALTCDPPVKRPPALRGDLGSCPKVPECALKPVGETHGAEDGRLQDLRFKVSTHTDFSPDAAGRTGRLLCDKLLPILVELVGIMAATKSRGEGYPRA